MHTREHFQEHELGNLLRYWRRQRGKSQLDLPLDTGISLRHLSFVESGPSTPSGTEIRIARKEKSMQTEKRENTSIKESWSVIHPLSPEDSAAMNALRSAVAAMKGKLEGVAARAPFNGIMEHVAHPDGISFETDTVGGICGWWAKPARARKPRSSTYTAAGSTGEQLLRSAISSAILH